MTGEIKNDKAKRKIVPYSILAFFLVIMTYYTVMALIAPARKISEINAAYGFKPAEGTKTDDRIFSDSAFVQMNRDKAFYQARITMAETDSVSLALNLKDSTATLEIRGVAVHVTKLSYIHITKVLNRADEYAVSSMLSVPFNIKESISTIKREPLMIKIAPKDTSEYKPDIIPDTSRVEAVNYILELDNGFRLYVYQQNDVSGGGLRRYLFDITDRFRNIADIFCQIFLFRVPEYHPSIRIKMDRSDAKIIYRALPRNGQIAVYR